MFSLANNAIYLKESEQSLKLTNSAKRELKESEQSLRLTNSAKSELKESEQSTLTKPYVLYLSFRLSPYTLRN